MAQWYTSNDYCFTHHDKIEINLKATTANNIIVSIFDHNRDAGNTLVEESTESSLDSVQEKISSYIHEKINVPPITKLLQLQK